jgi:hypothetical protein
MFVDLYPSVLQKHLNLPSTHRGLLNLPTNLVGRIFNSLPLILSYIPGIRLIYIQHSELEL